MASALAMESVSVFLLEWLSVTVAIIPDSEGATDLGQVTSEADEPLAPWSEPRH